MKQLNLVPFAIRKRSEYLALAKVAGIGLLLGCLATAALAIPLRLEVASTQKNIEGMKEREAQSEVARMATEKALIGDASDIEKIKQVNALSKTELSWEKAFAKVEALVPKDIRLTTYSFANAGGVVTLKMGGIAPSNLSFAVFVESLRASKDVISDLKVEGYTYDPTTKSVTFSLTTTAVVPPLLYSSAR
ncbi:MAG: hypothetical protein K0S20_693 [Patescibacteria group bacterium]|nr:hypothetical protein [Patescibacteria group bacterium]